MNHTSDATRDRWEIGSLVDEATGRASRPNPVQPHTGGPAGNARLAAWTGMILLVLLAAEGVTLIDVGGFITWHIIVGSLLVPPALLKVAVTGWRMLRYYAGNPSYRAAGPPPLLLRLLAPLVVLSTLALLATGIAEGVVGPQSGRASLWGTPASLLFLHQASFAVWIGATSLHVLGRLVPAARLIVGRAASAVEGRTLRGAAVLGALGAAVWVATIVLANSAGWLHAGR